MTNFDLSVRDWRGRVIGYRCVDCGGVFASMWGNVCNGCRDKDRRHREVVAAIKCATAVADQSPKPEFRTLAEQENFPICNQHTEQGGSYLATDDVLRRSERDMPEEVRPRYRVNPEFFIKAVLVIALLSGLALLVNSMR